MGLAGPCSRRSEVVCNSNTKLVDRMAMSGVETDGHYQGDWIPCSLCGETEFTPAVERRPIRKCRPCGLVEVRPRIETWTSDIYSPNLARLLGRKEQTHQGEAPGGETTAAFGRNRGLRWLRTIVNEAAFRWFPWTDRLLAVAARGHS